MTPLADPALRFPLRAFLGVGDEELAPWPCEPWGGGQIHPPSRLDALEVAAGRDVAGRAGGVPTELTFARTRRPMAVRLATDRDRGELPVRIVHNDAKIANVLSAATSRRRRPSSRRQSGRRSSLARS